MILFQYSVPSLLTHPFLAVGEQAGEPLTFLGGQAGNEAGEGVGVRGFLAFGATRRATSGRARRKLRVALTCDRSPFVSGARGCRFKSCRAYCPNFLG